jgi:hypothetical protein
MGLAQIAMLLDAQRRPGVDLALRDYLIRPEQHTPAPPGTDAQDPAAQEVTEEEAAATAEALGFKPRKKKKLPEHTETPAPP